MQIRLGQKIRELRKQSGKTQEEIALSLGVTSQAVSRWESGVGYPDMEYIPAIANVFHVTIDELFGYDSDRSIRIQAICDEADRYIKLMTELETCVQILRGAVREFPDEERLLRRLAYALTQLGWKNYGARGLTIDGCEYPLQDVEYNSKNPYWLEALELYERVLAMEISGEDRLSVIVAAVNIYTTMGMEDKAEALAQHQDPVMISREVLLASSAMGEKRELYQGEAILALMRQLKGVIQTQVLAKLSLHDGVGADKLIDTARLYESILDDGRCGRDHSEIGELYVVAAIMTARKGDIPTALAYWEKGFAHIETYRSIRETGEYRYTAPLVSKVSYPSGNWPIVLPTFWKGWLDCAPKELADAVRADGRFEKCFE